MEDGIEDYIFVFGLLVHSRDIINVKEIDELGNMDHYYEKEIWRLMLAISVVCAAVLVRISVISSLVDVEKIEKMET